MSLSGPVPPERLVAVVGGGIIGLSIGWRLAQSGWQVHVFDRAVVGGESSWAGAGMLAPGGEFEAHSHLLELALASRRDYRRFVQELESESASGIDFQECGALELAFSQDELAVLNEKAEKQKAFGIASKPLSPAQVYAFWPRVARGALAGARFYADDAIVNPREVVDALKIVGIRCGMQICEHCQVRQLSVESDGVYVESAGSQSRKYHAVVIASGAWSSEITVSGVPELPKAEPVKGQLIGYRQPEQTCTTIVRHGEYYFLQRANGMLIAGASVEHVGFDRQVNTVTTDHLARQAGLVFPHLTETTPTEAWVGFRPGGRELQLGAWHSSRLYLAYGHYRNGILLAPVTAELITKELNANWGRR